MIVAEPAAEIVPAEAVKLALADPAPTVTDPGTVSSGLLLDKLTTAPPLGAAADSNTVHVVDWPEFRLDELHPTAASVTDSGDNCIVVVWDPAVQFSSPRQAAVIVAVPAAAIVPAVAVKLALVAPAATVTDEGTGNKRLLEDNVTVAPPLGAAGETVTLHELDWPELRLEGLHPTPVSEDDTDNWIVAV